MLFHLTMQINISFKIYVFPQAPNYFSPTQNGNIELEKLPAESNHGYGKTKIIKAKT